MQPSDYTIQMEKYCKKQHADVHAFLMDEDTIAMLNAWKDDDHDEFCGGANSYKTTDGKVVFLTQAESYHHHGPAFAHYSQLEFMCIIQLQEKV
jgi:hypothetical protein